MHILFTNEWIDHLDLDLIEISFHSCENDFGISIILFGLGVAFLFDK